MEGLNALKQNLSEQIGDGIDKAIQAVKAVLDQQSLKRRELILIEGNYNDLLANERKRIVDPGVGELIRNKIRSSLMDLINTIEKSDASGYLQSRQSDKPQEEGDDWEQNFFYQHLKNPSLRDMEANFRKEENRSLLNELSAAVKATDCVVAEYCAHKTRRLHVLQEALNALIDELEDYDIHSYAFYERFLAIHSNLQKELDKRAFLIIINSQHELSDLIEVAYQTLKYKTDSIKDRLHAGNHQTGKSELEEELEEVETLLENLSNYLSEIARTAEKEFYRKN